MFAIALAVPSSANALQGTAYVLKEIAVISHPFGKGHCPRELNSGRIAVLGTFRNLFIFDPHSKETPSQRIDLFGVEDVIQVPESRLLLCAGHDLVAVDLDTGTFHLLNTPSIKAAGTDDNANDFGAISVHRETLRFVANGDFGFAYGNLTDLSSTRIVFSEYTWGAFLPDGRVVQAGEDSCRVCRLTPEGKGVDEVRFRSRNEGTDEVATLQNADQSLSKRMVTFSNASSLIRTAGDTDAAIAVLPKSRVTEGAAEAQTFEIWYISATEIVPLSIVGASAREKWEFDADTWVDTFVLNLDPLDSRRLQVVHFFRNGALISEIQLPRKGKPSVGPYVRLRFPGEAKNGTDIVSASWSGGNRILLTDSAGTLRIMACVHAESP